MKGIVLNGMELDFISIGIEEYDFAIPAELLSLEQVKAFMAILQSPGFEKRIMALGGYTLDNCATVLYI